MFNTAELISIGIANTRSILENESVAPVHKQEATRLHNGYCLLRAYPDKFSPKVKGETIHNLIEREICLDMRINRINDL